MLAGLRAHGRDNARTPMQWDDSAHAGFTTGTPWLAVNPSYPVVNAADQSDDPDSVLAHYRRLIALRHSEPAVVDGDFTMLLPEHEQVYAFTRRLDDVELLVMVNVSSEPADAAVEDEDGWRDAEVLVGSAYSATMGPWEHRVLRAASLRLVARPAAPSDLWTSADAQAGGGPPCRHGIHRPAPRLAHSSHHEPGTAARRARPRGQ